MNKVINPVIIQGGMGVWVSNWQLASAVSQSGQLGVVSGTAIETVIARILQQGDPQGHIRRALSHFPIPEIGERIIDKFFVSGGKHHGEPFKLVSLYSVHPSKELQELSVASAFSAIFLAKENHSGVVGINMLEKITLPNLATLYGAMLAGVDYVLMGAGIPKEIPQAIANLSDHLKASLKLPVKNKTRDHFMHFDPSELFPTLKARLSRPKFLPIVSSATLATSLLRKCKDAIYGFVVEAASAGGHNAPPRGKLALSSTGEPIYGPKDDIDLRAFRALGKPFWLAGSFGHPHQLEKARAAGASGIQVGTPFAFCNESGFSPAVKKDVLSKVLQGTVEIYTDPYASPSGFPFKVVALEGSISEKSVAADRSKKCDIGCLRTLYEKSDGTIGYTCPSEPEALYAKKGGNQNETFGRKCICNALLSAADMPQVQKDNYVEPPIVTAGQDIRSLKYFLDESQNGYGAGDVITYLLSKDEQLHA